MPCKEILENRKKSVPVADILRHAANNELQKPRGNTKTEFSCLAVTNTIRKLLRPDVYWFEDVKRCKQGKTVFKFLRELGVNSSSIYLFKGYPKEKSQQMRYAFLMLAADIAEEENLMC